MYYIIPAVMTGSPVIAAGAVAGLFSRGHVKSVTIKVKSLLSRGVGFRRVLTSIITLL